MSSTSELGRGGKGHCEANLETAQMKWLLLKEVLRAGFGKGAGHMDEFCRTSFRRETLRKTAPS